LTRLDERLRRELERAGRPADPTGVYEELIRRRERRRIVRRVEAGVLALAVSVGSAVGIWSLTRSGEGVVATPGPGNEIAAVLSDGDYRLALISAEDGSVRTLLPPGSLSSPFSPVPMAWSPDGGTLAIWSGGDPRPGSGAPGIYLVPGDGGEPALLYETRREEEILSVGDMAWSPDGARIAFVVPDAFTVSEGSGGAWSVTGWSVGPIVYTVAADGSDPQRLPIEGNVRDLAWSPDGSTLAVTKIRAGGGQDIYLVDLETGTETRLTDDGGSSDPAWSPDGRQIAFTSGDARLRGLFVMNADGTGRRRLTYPDGGDLHPTWSPDGRWIAVSRSMWITSSASGAVGPSGLPGGPLGASGPLGYGPACQVVLVAADGSGERVLVDGPIDGACATQLAWRPAPSTGTTEEPTPGATASPAATPSPAPTAGPAPGFDLASVCDLSALQADYDGDGALDVAVVATLLRDGGCPQPGKGETYLGIGFGQTEQDVGAGTLRTDLTFGPIECGASVGCRVFAAPDLDGDGAAELAVVQDAGASVEILGLYRVDLCGPTQFCATRAWISPIEIAEPGDPALPLEPGPARIVWGGSVMDSFGAYCGPMQGSPPTDQTGFVVWRASTPSEGSAPAVHEALFRLRGARLVLLATHDYAAASTADLPPGGGEDLCGAPVAASSGD
jgi:Tol biopolymer transport system component